MAPVLDLLFALIAGRLGLLLLPSGEAGTRSLFGVSDALAPALLLGLSVRALGEAVGAGAWSLVALAGLAGLRLALGPAALVPRYRRTEPVLPSGVLWIQHGLWLLVVGLAAAFDRPVMAVAALIAWLVGTGLERLGAPLPIRNVGAACGLMLAIGGTSQMDDWSGPLAFALAFGTGTLAAGWVRRADRRDLALASVTAAALPSPATGFVLLAAILAATRRPRLARDWVLGAVLVLGLRVVLGADLVGASVLTGAFGAAAGVAFIAIARVRDVRRALESPSQA